MCDSYGVLRLHLISSDAILADSIGEDGEVIFRGDDITQSEIDIDFITCSLRQQYRYRRALKDGSTRILQNEAVLECVAPKDELDKGNKWKLRAHVQLKIGAENVLEQSQQIPKMDVRHGNIGTMTKPHMSKKRRKSVKL